MQGDPDRGIQQRRRALLATILNSGGTAAGAFRVGIYLSTDAVCTTADTLIGSRTIAGLAGGAGSTDATSATIPAGTQPGALFVCAIADDLLQVAEHLEDNNAAAAPVTILPLLPTVTLKVNGQQPPTKVVTTTGPLALTLSISPSAYTAPLSWYWLVLVGNQAFFITSTGVSTTPAPLLVAPPAAVTDLPLLNVNVPPATTITNVFILIDGGGSVVGLDYISAVR